MNRLSVPLVSLALAVLLSVMSGPSPRALARRALLATGECFAQGDLSSATATVTAYNFDVPPPIKVKVQAEDSSVLDIFAELEIQVQVVVTNELGQQNTQIVNVVRKMPKDKHKSYSGPVNKIDTLNSGFKLTAAQFEGTATSMAKDQIRATNQTLPKPARFSLQGATGALAAVAANPVPVIHIDGTYVCTKNGQGTFLDSFIALTLNAQGTGGGKFPPGP